MESFMTMRTLNYVFLSCVSLCLKLVELQNCKNDDKFPPYCAEPDGVTNKQSHG